MRKFDKSLFPSFFFLRSIFFLVKKNILSNVYKIFPRKFNLPPEFLPLRPQGKHFSATKMPEYQLKIPIFVYIPSIFNFRHLILWNMFYHDCYIIRNDATCICNETLLACFMILDNFVNFTSNFILPHLRFITLLELRILRLTETKSIELEKLWENFCSST